MDFGFIREYTPMYVEAAKLTMSIAFQGILLSTLFGFICCLIRYFRGSYFTADREYLYRTIKKYTSFDSIIFLIFWITEVRNLFKF